jgi:Ca2+/Na+ antiporter
MEFTAGLFLFYIILVAKYFDKMLSCDFQRFMETNILAKHVLAFISAFYVIVITETDKENTDKTMFDYFVTTLSIYLIFLLSTKAKAQYVFPMLLLLLIDQLLKVYVDTKENKAKKEKEQGLPQEYQGENKNNLTEIDIISIIRKILGYSIIILIIVGFFSYYFRQRAEFGESFSTSKFILGTFKCKMPNANNS